MLIATILLIYTFVYTGYSIRENKINKHDKQKLLPTRSFAFLLDCKEDFTSAIIKCKLC